MATSTQTIDWMGELSEYETKRQRCIARNEEKLKTLNILKTSRPCRLIVVKKAKSIALKSVRRSLRQRQLHEKTIEKHKTVTKSMKVLGIVRVNSKRRKQEFFTALDLPFTNPRARHVVSNGPKQHVTSSELEIPLEDFHLKFIGRQMLPVGKQTVMQTLSPVGFVAKFSIMSGVQPWKNAVALFVNVASTSSGYDNTFYHENMMDGCQGVYFQWFGQNRWHDESPMVMRLKAMKRGDVRWKFDTSYDDENEKTDESLLLFLRHLQGPYIYCGRLGYLGHRPASRPLEFRWQLLDLDLLSWEQIRGLLDSSA